MGSPCFVPCCTFVVFPLLGVAAIIAGWMYIARSPWRSGQEPHCPKCDYNLTGSASAICPECGTPREEHMAVRGERRRDALALFIGWLLLIVGASLLLYCGLAMIGY